MNHPAGAVPAPPSTRRSAPDAAAPWTLGAPALEHALQLLRGAAPVPAAAAAVFGRVQGALSAFDQEVLRSETLPFEPAPLRAALGTQLRLALALEHTARTGAPEADALNVLLAEVDAVLDGLRGYEAQALPALLERVPALRDALVRDAVALSEVRAKGAPATPVAAPAATLSSKAAAKATGKVVLHSATEAAAAGTRQRKQRVLLAVLGLTVLGGAGYHLHAARTQFTAYPPVAGAPAGLGLLQSDGARRLVRTQDGQPLTAEQRAWLQQQEQQGLRVVKLSATTFLLEPAPASARAAAAP